VYGPGKLIQEQRSNIVAGFSSEKEIVNKTKKRSDFLPVSQALDNVFNMLIMFQNEMYITPHTDVNALASINGKATIMSEKAFMKKYPTGKLPKKSKEQGKTFICRRGCNTQSTIYTDEFDWENLRHSTLEDMEKLVEWIKSGTQSNKKRKPGRPSKKDEDYRGGHVDDEDAELETPRKKQKHSNVSTPRKVRTPSKLLTPSHKRYTISMIYSLLC
jgi:origin recognition complex subunit 1